MNDRFTSVLLVAAVLAGILVTVIHLGEQNRSEVAKLRQEIETLGMRQETTRNEVRDALRRQAITEASTVRQRDIVLDTGDAPFKGNTNAPATMIEFADFESPECARSARETLPQLERDYIANGKLRYVFRSFPEDPNHAVAFRTQEAARCAGEQGKFWQMHDWFFAQRTNSNVGALTARAQELGVDRSKFVTCFDGGLQAPAIRRDILDGQKNGVTSAPTFFIGPTNPNATSLRVTRIIKGAAPYSQFKEAIDALLGAG